MDHQVNKFEVDIDEHLQKMQRAVEGTYPDGRLDEKDEGAIAFAVGADGGRVVILFARSLTRLIITPQDALEIAESLIAKANALIEANEIANRS